MDLSLLQTLKEKIATAQKFDEVWTYFFDHFGEDAEFMKLGEATDHPFLEQVFVQVCARLFPSHVVLTRMLYTRLAAQHFVHGGLTINGRLATVMYFEDVQLGMLVIAAPRAGANNEYVRFTGRPAPPRDAKPSLN
jgi:hypothetical protein